MGSLLVALMIAAVIKKKAIGVMEPQSLRALQRGACSAQYFASFACAPRKATE